MQIFLLWRRTGERGRALDPQRVASNLWKIFTPLFGSTPKTTIRQNGAAAVVYLNLPVEGWVPGHVQEDDQVWALALDFPVDAPAALAAQGIQATARRALPPLCQAMQRDPAPLLREMAPHFALVWMPKDQDEAFIQTDGLGFAQMFEYEHQGVHAFTNKIVALSALGVSLEPEPLDWAVRFSIGWFPLDLTGVKRTRYMPPGAQISLSPEGIGRKRIDVLSGWLRAEGLSPQDCAELARSSIHKHVRMAAPLWTKAAAGLTGGWDSRAIMAVLLSEGVGNFQAGVSGRRWSPDVIIASRLAKLAHLRLQVSNRNTGPPGSPLRLRRSVAMALLWQAGYIQNQSHKLFLARRRHLAAGGVNIMGQYGEIARGYYTERIGAQRAKVRRFESRLIEFLLLETPPFIRSSLQDDIVDVLRTAYHQADAFNLQSFDRLDFFYLYERTRRWASGGIYFQPGRVIAPYLNPDFIRASFAYPGNLRTDGAFHRHILEVDMPIWSSVEYTDHVSDFKQLLERRAARMREMEALAAGGSPPAEVPAHDAYWDEVAKPLMDECLSQGGFWTEVFDADKVEKHWREAPDALLIAHLLPTVLGGLPATGGDRLLE